MTAAVGHLTKVYDGTTAVAADKPDGLDVKFSGLVDQNDLKNRAGYSVSSLSFADGNAGAANRTVNGTVTLDTSTIMGKNYVFASGVSTTFSKGGITISKKTPVKEDFTYTIPTGLLNNGAGRGIGTVSWNSKYTSTGDTRTVFYDARTGLGPVTTLPILNGSYTVTLNVTGSNNFDNVTGLELTATGAKFVIGQEKEAGVRVTAAENGDTTQNLAGTAYLESNVTLRATGYYPDSAKIDKAGSAQGAQDSILYYSPKGTLTYLWFVQGPGAPAYDTLRQSNGRTAVTTPTYTFATPDVAAGTQYKYKCEITYTNPTVQVTTKKLSDELVVSVAAAKVSLSDAVVTVGGTYTYNGTAFTNATVTNVTVRVGTSTLTKDTHYTQEVFGEFAGPGTVQITGIGAYKDIAVGTFTIAKKTTVLTDLTIGSTVQYNGEAQPLSVTAKAPYMGLGAVTIKYVSVKESGEADTALTAPKNAGSYTALVSIAEGQNFTALDEFERQYKITQRIAVKADFNYTAVPPPAAWTGKPITPIVATLKNKMDYTGTLKTVYGVNNTDTIPTAVGKHPIRVLVGGDANFAMAYVTLDTLVIMPEGWVSVAEANREIPKQIVISEAAVAPVKAVVASFTAGPSPAKLGSAIKFFSAKAVKSGSLYIFDASGNSVAKKSVKAGVGEIGSWDLKSKGVAVSEGTYVVKGALVGKDGTREKVSFVFSVVR